MKLIITLCIIVAAIALPGTKAASKDVLDYFKERIESVSNDLESYDANLMPDLTIKLEDKRNLMLNEVYIVRESTYYDSQAKIEAAKLEGKNVDQCLRDLKIAVNKSEHEASEFMQTCVAANLLSLSTLQNEVLKLLVSGERIIEQLETIMEECANEDLAVVESCIAPEILSTSRTVGKYYASVSGLKFIEEAVVFTAPFLTSVCMTKPMFDFKLSAQTGLLNIVECIEKA